MSDRRICRGDLYWVAAEDSLGQVAHPHVVVQDDLFNHSRVETVVVVAVTSNLGRAKEPGNVLLAAGEGGLERASVVVAAQVLSVAKTRLGAKIGCLSAARVDEILAGLRFLQRTYFGG